MTYRLLPPSEWHKLEPLFAANNQPVPPPVACLAAVGENEQGEIKGILICLIVCHVEPLILQSPYVNFMRLLDTIRVGISNHKGMKYYCFTNGDTTEGMAKLAGLLKMPYNVWEGEVN